MQALSLYHEEDYNGNVKLTEGTTVNKNNFKEGISNNLNML
jgi:hypothetical protein